MTVQKREFKLILEFTDEPEIKTIDLVIDHAWPLLEQAVEAAKLFLANYVPPKQLRCCILTQHEYSVESRRTFEIDACNRRYRQKLARDNLKLGDFVRNTNGRHGMIYRTIDCPDNCVFVLLAGSQGAVFIPITDLVVLKVQEDG